MIIFWVTQLEAYLHSREYPGHFKSKQIEKKAKQFLFASKQPEIQHQ